MGSPADLIDTQLDRCVRCGTCMAVCPVYDVMRQEGAVARGKLGLIRALRPIGRFYFAITQAWMRAP